MAVRDIGAFAAIAFDRPEHFLGRTVEIAGDVLTPPQIAETFARHCGLPTRLRQVPVEQRRAFDQQLAKMFEFFNEHPRRPARHLSSAGGPPGLMTLGTWLRSTGWKPNPGNEET